MVAPLLRTLPHVIAAVVAIIVALLAVNVPYSLGLIIAGSAGMAAGALSETYLTRKALT